MGASATAQRRRPRLAARTRLRWDTIEERYMLIFPEAALMLNKTAGEILKLCDGERTVDQIVDRLADTFAGTDRPTLAAEVATLLSRVQTRGLLEMV